MHKMSLLYLFIFILSAQLLQGQNNVDTLEISYKDAEKKFLANNLSLLANRYSIDVNKELIRQAKLWDNPVLSTDQNLYDGKFLQHNANSGQFYVQLMQLIKTAGKRNKAAQIAIDNTTLSQQQFDDLLRTLRYTLHNDLLEVNHLLKIKNVYTTEITEVNKLSKGMDILLEAGNVSVKDNLRIKALLFNLQNELVTAEAQLINIESELKLLLNNNSEATFITPQMEYKLADLTTISLPNIDTLTQQALIERPDARIAQTTLALQNHNLIYQKALAKPDVSIGTEFDQRSNYANNYVGLAISLPLNILNRNQGNIASAKFSIQQQQAVIDLTTATIKHQISSASNKFIFYQNINNKQQLDFARQYDLMFTNMLNTYEHRQLSLLEFIDFMDSYKDTKLKLIEQHNGLIHAAEDLNYAVGKDIIQMN